MSTAVTLAFEAIAKRLDIILRAAGDLQAAEEYAKAMGHFEAFLTREFKALHKANPTGSITVERLSHFKVIAQRLGSNAPAANLLKNLVDDAAIIGDEFLPLLEKGKAFVSDSGHLISADLKAFRKDAMQSLSTGLKQSNPFVLRRYAHNVHLPSQLMRDPTQFLPSALGRYTDALRTQKLWLVLEQNPLAVTSMTDMTVQVLAKVQATVGGVKVDLMRHRRTTLPVSFDSKVCYDPASLTKGKALEQQFNLFMSDRFKLLDDMLRELNTVHKASGPEKEAFLQEFVPAAFGHYVFAPHDFVDTGGAIAKAYTAHFDNAVDVFAEVQLESGVVDMSDSDFDACLKAIKAFNQSHFGSGAFLNLNSQMSLH